MTHRTENLWVLACLALGVAIVGFAVREHQAQQREIEQGVVLEQGSGSQEQGASRADVAEREPYSAAQVQEVIGDADGDGVIMVARVRCGYGVVLLGAETIEAATQDWTVATNHTRDAGITVLTDDPVCMAHFLRTLGDLEQ